jgi:ankyrin repeat protein
MRTVRSSRQGPPRETTKATRTLHSAADSLNKDLASVLLHAGCDPNAVDDVGHTALVKVLWAHNPKKDLIEILLEHGADPEAKHGGESAIEIATQTGQMN